MPRLSGSTWRAIAILLGVLVVVQSILICIFISPSSNSGEARMTVALDSPALVVPITTVAITTVSTTSTGNPDSITSSSTGVAVTLMLHAPKWFARRYPIMLQNALANIPQNWQVQVFVNTRWLEKDVLPLHPGLHRMYGTNPSETTSWTMDRITWTPIPVKDTRKRPKDIMKSTWFWTNILEENVLMFSGNGAICTNGGSTVEDFLHLDYIGTPSHHHHGGKGGDGSTHSFRHRSVMLSILEQYPPTDDDPDFQYFLKHLDQDPYHIADREMTQLFGGFQELERAPFLVSGIQSSLNFTMRDNLLNVCPELKAIFPSLHEPGCFGAHPDGPKCRESICALRDVIPPQGC